MALDLVCPGAVPLASRDPRDTDLICGPLALDRDRDDRGHRQDTEQVVFRLRSDPSTVAGFCCGDYTECVIWREEKERHWDLRDGLREQGAIL